MFPTRIAGNPVHSTSALETDSSSGSLLVPSHPLVVPSFLGVKTLAPIFACSLTHGTCVACQKTPDEPTAPFQRNVHARSPTVTLGGPMLSSTGKHVARFDEAYKVPQSFTIPNPRCARNVPTVNLPSSAEEVYPQNFVVGQPKKHISDLQFEKFPTFATFKCWKTSFKTEVCSSSKYPSESMRWMKEVEMASVDDLDKFWKSIPKLRDA